MSQSQSRQRTALVALRLLPSEKVSLEAAAAAAGMNLSEFIRDAALTAAKPQP